SGSTRCVALEGAPYGINLGPISADLCRPETSWRWIVIEIQNQGGESLMELRSIARHATACLFAVAMRLGTAQAAELGAKDEPIKLAMLEWTGAHVSTHIAGQLLEKLGYKVEYVTAGNFPQFSGLSDGSLSASVEVWLNNVGDIYPKVLAAKQIEDIGKLD